MKQNLATLVSTTPEGEEKDKLTELGGDLFGSHIQYKRVSVLDLLERFKTNKLSVGGFIDMLPPLRVRTYSISSSPQWNLSHASLTVSIIEQPAFSGQGTFYGVGSNFLADLIPGDAVHITIRPCKEDFRAPKDASAYPIIMIAAGSGIAPFRGFIQDRALQKRKGIVLQPAILFFGCRGSQQDNLYYQEMDSMEVEGVVSVRRAFSAEKSGPQSQPRVYVQDKLWEHREEVIQLWNQGAKFYVCGGVKMADEVHKVFTKIIHPLVEASCSVDGRNLDIAFEEAISRRYVAEIFSQT